MLLFYETSLLNRKPCFCRKYLFCILGVVLAKKIYKLVHFFQILHGTRKKDNSCIDYFTNKENTVSRLWDFLKLVLEI